MSYTVVMPVISVRISEEELHQRLKRKAAEDQVGVSRLVERLIDEGLRMATHPAVLFRSGPSGRRPVLVAGPEVADAVSAVIGGDVQPGQRRSRAAEMLAIPESMVDAALLYYAEFTEEIDNLLALRAEVAEREEAAWRRQHQLLRS